MIVVQETRVLPAGWPFDTKYTIPTFSSLSSSPLSKNLANNAKAKSPYTLSNLLHCTTAVQIEEEAEEEEEEVEEAGPNEKVFTGCTSWAASTWATRPRRSLSLETFSCSSFFFHHRISGKFSSSSLRLFSSTFMFFFSFFCVYAVVARSVVVCCEYPTSHPFCKGVTARGRAHAYTIVKKRKKKFYQCDYDDKAGDLFERGHCTRADIRAYQWTVCRHWHTSARVSLWYQLSYIHIYKFKDLVLDHRGGFSSIFISGLVSEYAYAVYRTSQLGPSSSSRSLFL